MHAFFSSSMVFSCQVPPSGTIMALCSIECAGANMAACSALLNTALLSLALLCTCRCIGHGQGVGGFCGKPGAGRCATACC